MLPLTVKGVIWYQGESNVERPEQYRMLFPELVRTWRRYFADDNLPFYYVQIAPYNHQKVNSAIFREVGLYEDNSQCGHGSDFGCRGGGYYSSGA